LWVNLPRPSRRQLGADSGSHAESRPKAAFFRYRLSDQVSNNSGFGLRR
jgi:hypothetical protein